MARSTLDPDTFPVGKPRAPKGHDTKSLGPSDSSDSGSDIVDAGGGLDQAEEAQRGKTDEEIENEAPKVRPRGRR